MNAQGELDTQSSTAALNAASVTLSGNVGVEVGDTSTYTVTLTPKATTGGDIEKIVEVVGFWWWSANNQYAGGYPAKGKSNIEGYFDATKYPYSEASPLILTSTSLTSTVDIVWGDFRDECLDYVYVKTFFNVFNKKPDGTKGALRENAFITYKLLVNIYCVQEPVITGKNPVQTCCADTVEYCDDSAGTQDSWLWKIRGEGADTTVYGTGEKGQGKKCIKVAVHDTGEFVVSAKAWRKNGHEDLIREDSISIKRFQPQTSAITLSSNAYGGEFGNQLWACTGEDIEVCVDAICGMSGVSWNFGRGFDIISGAGTRCVIIRPRTTYAPDDSGYGGVIPEGAVITITAQVNMTGGCSTSTSSVNIPIFTGGIPPEPDGQVFVDTDPADPCGPYADYMVIEYVDETPYVGGYTTWYPQEVRFIFNSDNTIDVTVCNINACSQIYTCKVYTEPLPEPCQNPIPFWSVDDGNIDGTNIDFKARKESVELTIQNQLKRQDIIVYPNPASNSINIRTSKLLTAKVVLLDAQGRKLIEAKLENSANLGLEIPASLSNGVYYLSIQDNKKIIVKKITIQR